MRLFLIITLLISCSLAGSWQALAQQLPPDTLLFSTARTNAWQMPLADKVAELTPAGYHLRYIDADTAGSTIAADYFTLNAAADYSLEVRLRVHGRAGLLWGYRKRRNSDSPHPSDYQILQLELDHATPLVVLWHVRTGRVEKLFQQTVPAGFDKDAPHTLRVAREGARVRFFLDGKPLYELPAPADWPGPRQEIGLHVEKAGSEAWMSEALFRHHWHIRRAPGVPAGFRRERLASLNSLGEELAPIVSANGQFLFFTRTMGNPAVPNERNEDIFVSERAPDGSWRAPHNLGPPVNTSTSDDLVQVSPDGQTLLVKGQYQGNGNRTLGGVSQSTRQADGTWSLPQSYTQALNIRNLGLRLTRTLSASGTVALVTGDTLGNINHGDIYFSLRQPDGSWAPLQSLGPDINTRGSDQCPFLAPDGKTLYFSSNGHPGYGNNDIFVSTRLDDTWQHWSPPLNLGPGVNTPGYESYFSLPASGEYAYLVSEEPSSEFYDTDIYRLRLPPSLKPAATVLVRGRVLDARTNQPIANADMRYEQLPAGTEVGHLRLGGAGGFEIALPAGQQYGFRAEAPGYLAASNNLDLAKTTAYGEVTQDLYLLPLTPPTEPLPTTAAKVQAGRLDAAVPQQVRGVALAKPAPPAEERIVLNNVFFVRGKPQLLAGSFPELNRLAQTLAANPGLAIRLDGHTDNTGDAQDPKPNQVLSEQRVAAVKAYLAKRGVAASRLSTQGYGGSRPVAPNDNEAHKAQNRRVEFVVLSR